MFYGVAFTIILCVVTYASVIVFQEYHKCADTQMENNSLLWSPACMDPMLRVTYGPKQVAACDKAKHENRIGPWLCAFSVSWSAGEVYRIWSMVTESQLMMFGLAAITIVSIVAAWDRRAQYAFLERAIQPRAPQYQSIGYEEQPRFLRRY